MNEITRGIPVYRYAKPDREGFPAGFSEGVDEENYSGASPSRTAGSAVAVVARFAQSTWNISAAASL